MDAGPSGAPHDDASARAPFVGSLPIAAMLVGEEEVRAGALAVVRKSVDVAVLGAEGPRSGPVAALRDVAWLSDADLRLGGSRQSPILVFRGLVSGKRRRAGVFLSEAFLPAGEPAVIEASHCVSGRHLAWLEPGGHELVRRTRETSARFKLGTVDPDATLACGDTLDWVLVDRDGDHDVVTARAHQDGGAAPREALFRDAEDDETREVLALPRGDEATFLRVGQAGSLSLRRIGTPARPPRTLATRVDREDDVVAALAGDAGVVVVVTHEEDVGCDGGAPTPRVDAVAVDDTRDTLVTLAAATCGRERGPFFVNTLADGSWAIAWVERAATRGRTTAPIVGVRHAILQRAALPLTGETSLSADGVADAKCGKKRCAFVALERPRGQDDSQPEPLRAHFYP